MPSGTAPFFSILARPLPSPASRRHNPTMLRRLTSTLPILGILVAFFLYLHSAALYSAATSNEPARGGYRHFGNYWCQLYDEVTFTGQHNTGVPYALGSTFAIIVALFFFWFSVSWLFSEFFGLCLIVRIAGPLAAAIAALIFTTWHDSVITFAAPLGFAAVVATCIGLARKRYWILLALGIAGVTVGIADYLLWKFELLKPQQPLIQKTAFALIFLWVVVTAIKVLMIPNALKGQRNVATGGADRRA